MLQCSTPAVGVIAIGAPAGSDGLRGRAGHDMCVMDTLLRLGRGPVHRSPLETASADGAESLPGNALGSTQHANRLLTTVPRAVVFADVPRMLDELEAETRALLGLFRRSRQTAEWRA